MRGLAPYLLCTWPLVHCFWIYFPKCPAPQSPVPLSNNPKTQEKPFSNGSSLTNGSKASVKQWSTIDQNKVLLDTWAQKYRQKIILTYSVGNKITFAIGTTFSPSTDVCLCLYSNGREKVLQMSIYIQHTPLYKYKIAKRTTKSATEKCKHI